MKTTWNLLRTAALVAASMLLVAVRDAEAAKGAKPSHATAHHATGGHVSVPHQAVPRMVVRPPKVMLPAVPRQVMKPKVARPQATRSQATRSQASRSQASQRRPTTMGLNRRTHARRRGYSLGNRYATSSAANRSIIQRLRSAHSTLARVSHDYRGHRVKAMGAITQAIRHLEHRSSASRRMAFAMPALAARNGVGAGAGGVKAAPMSKAQADSRVRRSLSTLQSVDQHLAGLASLGSVTHTRARGSVQRAMRELNLGLSVR
jgi:hypothetical protein